jgi:membrane associated rhomboid family serine protease
MMGQFMMPKLTPGVKYLLIVNAGLFILGLIPDVQVFFAQYFYLHYTLDAPASFWIWQPFTYMFFHDPNWITHILFNMLLLYFLGNMVETKMGTQHFLFFYIGCGAVAGLGDVLIKGVLFPGLLPSAHTATLGASGAMYAVFAAFVYFWHNMKLLFFGIIPIRSLYLILVIVGIDVLSLLSGRMAGIAFLVHILGALSAFAYIHYRYRMYNFTGMIRNRFNLEERSSSSPFKRNRSSKNSSSEETKIHYFPDNVRKPDRSTTRPTAKDIDSMSDIEIREYMDELLEKISRTGIESLTQDEKEFLDRVSRKYQN